MPYGRRGGEIVVNKQLVGSQITPSIAGFAGGGFIVVWSTTDALQDGAGRAIKAQRYDTLGNPVGVELLINAAAAGDQRAPSVATLPSGGYVVTWETTDATQDGSGVAIKGQVFDSAGAPAGAEFLVNSQATADQTRSSVTALEDGRFVVTWQTADSAQDGHTTAIKGKIFSAAGVALGSEFLVNSGAVGGESSPNVTSLGGGGFVATWTLGSGTDADIYAQVFDASGAKAGSQFRVSTTSIYNQDFASVSQISGGRFVVTWQSSASLTTGDVEIRARIFSADGSPIGNDFLVSTTRIDSTTGSLAGASRPSVEDLPDGGFVIAWTTSGGSYITTAIRGQFFDASGNRAGGEVLISTVTNRLEGPTDVAVDGNGMLFAVWTSANQSAQDEDIRGQFYVASGAPEIVSNGGGSTAAVTVAENQNAVTTVAAVDPEGSAGLTFSIVGGHDASRFAINASTGALTFIQAPNFEVRQDFLNNNVYDVVVSVSDGALTDIQALAVTVSNVNEGVTISGSETYYFHRENGTSVATFSATDADGDTVTWSIAGGADAARFAIDPVTGALRFVAAPNFEAPGDSDANNFYQVTIAASDGSLSSTRALTIEIANLDEGPVIVSGGGGDSASVSVAENIHFVTTIVADDPDARDSAYSFSIVGGADAALFTIQASTGQLFFRNNAGGNFEAPSDADGNNVYEVVVAVSDGFNPADTQALSITVTDANDPPVITSNGGGSLASVSLAENQLDVTTVTASDLENAALTYAIAGGADAARFTIDPQSGLLSFVSAPNFEAPADAGANNVYNVTVSVSDGDKSDTQQLAITVLNANDAPVISSNGGGSEAAIAMAENELAVTTVAASDLEGAALTYSIAGGADASSFLIDSATGALSFLMAPDYEQPGDSDGNNLYEVVVRASDGTLSDTQALMIAVGDANERPIIVSNGGGTSAFVSLDEGQTAVTTIVADDPEGSGAITYSITGGPHADLFAIDSATGVLSFAAAPDYETPLGESSNFYSVTVTASDGELSSFQSVQVEVRNVNEGVTITSPAQASLQENGIAVTIVTAADLDGDTVSFAITGGADASRFAIDAATGALSFVGAPNFEAPADADGDNVYQLVVSASDGTFSGSRAMTVTVLNQNEPVAFVSGGGGAEASVTLDENKGDVLGLLAVDQDGTEPHYGIAGGADAALFELDPVTKALRFKALPDFETPGDANGDNVYEVVVGATDGQHFDYQTVFVTVANVYEGISFAAPGSAVSVGENGTAAGAVAATGEAGATITYAVTGGADAASFTIDPVSGALSFRAAPDFEAAGDEGGDNVYDVVVTASDGRASASQAVTVTVGNVDEGVEIASYGGEQSVSLTMDENGWRVGQVQAFDLDGYEDQVTYSIAGGADSALFAVDPVTGALTFVFDSRPDFEAPADADGDNVYQVTVAASSGAFSAAQAFSVTIVNDNEGIWITSNGGGSSADIAIAENSRNVTTVTAFDPDGTTPTFLITGGADASLFTIDAQTGVLSFIEAPDHESPGDAGGDNVYEVTVAASDGYYATGQDLSITVGNVDEPVEILSYGGAAAVALTLIENSLSVGEVAARDEEDWPVTFAITGGADAARFQVDRYTGALSFIYGAYPDFEAPADAGGDNVYDVVVTASSTTSSADQAFAITIANRNEGLWITSDGGGDATLSVNEGDRNVTTVVAYDQDGDVPTYSIVGGPDAALFAIDPATGVLTFIAAPDHEAPNSAAGTNFYTVEVGASDGEHMGRQKIRIGIDNVNEGVAITSGGGAATLAVTVGENGEAVTTVTASDVDGDAVTYSITGGADASRFAIDPQTGALRFLEAPNFEAPADSDGDNVYDVVVSATDGAFADSQAVAVTVENVNESVAITSSGGGASASVAVAENGTAVATVTASDPDGGAITYAIAGGADAARFTIDSTTGVLAFVAAPNFEAPADAGANNVYELIVSASDGSSTDTQTLAVTVGNVNEGVVITSNGGGAGAAVAAAENATIVATVAAVDLDGGAVTYAIAGGADSARFRIDAATGVLTFIAAPDFEAPGDVGGDNVYDVLVSASDGSFTDTQAIAVLVGNVNEAPAVTSNGGGAAAAVSVAENSAGVTTVAATDPDGASLAYSIVGGADAARFTINPQTGLLQFVAAPDYELPADANGDNVYAVVVRASDGQLFDDQALSVTVGNVRDGNNVTGTSGSDTISATSLNIALRTSNEEDVVYGRDGHDNIQGMAGDDELYGEGGNDVLVGGAGADRLTGGLGKDQFTYHGTSESAGAARDTILDFSRAQGDKISLSAIDANSGLSNDQAFTFIGTAAFSNVAGQLRYETSGGVTIVSGDVNGDGVADLHIELSGSIALIASDFVL